MYGSFPLVSGAAPTSQRIEAVEPIKQRILAEWRENGAPWLKTPEQQQRAFSESGPSSSAPGSQDNSSTADGDNDTLAPPNYGRNDNVANWDAQSSVSTLFPGMEDKARESKKQGNWRQKMTEKLRRKSTQGTEGGDSVIR